MRLDRMTRCDYLVVMRKVRIADLKTHISEHLRAVRRGDSFTVMDRDTPIAYLVPYAAGPGKLKVRRAKGKYSSPSKVPLPRPSRIKTDVVALLLEERQVDR